MEVSIQKTDNKLLKIEFMDFSPFCKRLKMTKFAVISKWRSAFSLSVIASKPQGERGNPYFTKAQNDKVCCHCEHQTPKKFTHGLKIQGFAPRKIPQSLFA